MIGYHYTSEELWKRIQKEGLIPYPIIKPELEEYFLEGVKGIWVWENKLEGKSQLGSILYQMSTKQSTSIVELKIDYNENEILSYKKGKITLFHDGIMGFWNYHTREPAIILIKKVLPLRISLVKKYDLYQILK